MKKTTWITVLTGLMVLLFIVCYVGIETQVRGVTKDKIKTGAWIAMSGALAYPGTSFMYSTQAYFDYINDQGASTEGNSNTLHITTIMNLQNQWQ
jgi:hypothetical protein